VRAELISAHDAYVQVAGSHDGWRIAAVYLRESKREQVEGFSPGAQLKATLEEAARRRLWVPQGHVFIDLMSGRREDRTQFQDLMLLGRSGSIAAVLVMHTSRWARNSLISKKYKKELRDRGVEVTALNAPFDVTRPEGRFAEGVVELVDEFTSDTIGWWVSVGLREKHERGMPLGRLPETFFKDVHGNTVPHPELSKIVLEGARRYATGKVGFGELARWSNREGHRTPSGRHLTDEWWRNTLKNPLNAGYVGYKRKKGGKELRRAALEGFIPLDLFERCERVRQTRTRKPGQRARYRVYVMSGATCGSCGGQVVASSKSRLRCGRAGQHAGCDEPSVRAENLEQQFGEWLRRALSLTDAAKPKLASLVRAVLARGQDQGAAQRTRIAIRRLNDAYVESQAMDRAEYLERLAGLKAQLARLERVPDERLIAAATKVAQDIGVVWEAASPERRKQLRETLFESVTVASGRVVAVRPRPEVAPLVAVKVHICGPDRIRTGDLVLDRDVC
jgi:DNA invertase Pin-like site-specific DNA recombinase